MLLKLLISSVFLFNQLATAQGPSETSNARVLPYLVNTTQNVGGLLQAVQPFVTESEMSSTREFLTKHGANEQAELPKITMNGSEIMIGDLKLSLTSDGAVKYNGTVFRVKKQEGFDQLVRSIHTSLTGAKGNQSAIFKLVLPYADAKPKEATYKMTNASGESVLITGAVLALLIGATAVFLGSWVVAGATVGVIAAVGALAIGIAKFASRNDARVYCDGKRMTIKSGMEEAKFDFSKDKTQPSAEIKNSKVAGVKKIEKFEAEAASALSSVYVQACESKKSDEINAALEKVQTASFKKATSAGGVRGTR